MCDINKWSAKNLLLKTYVWNHRHESVIQIQLLIKFLNTNITHSFLLSKSIFNLEYLLSKFLKKKIEILFCALSIIQFVWGTMLCPRDRHSYNMLPNSYNIMINSKSFSLLRVLVFTSQTITLGNYLMCV